MVILNMLNQFYNYLATHIINFWEKEGVRSGDKYFLRLDTQEEVSQMLEAFANVRPDIVSVYIYDDEGVTFSSYAVSIGDVQVVLAGSTEEVTVDYIGRLRNFVSDRQKGWEDKALFSVTAESLDTLSGGGANLQNRGMPLHTDSLITQLRQDIKKSNLKASEQVILLDVLRDLQDLDRIMGIPLNDFSEVLSILEKGKIDSIDYRGLELFEDPELENFPEKEIERRLQRNREAFRDIQDAHQRGEPEEILENMFTDNGVKRFKKEDWYEETFPNVYKEMEKFKKTQKSKKVTVESVELLSDDASLWLRYPGETAAKRRQNMILIFNPRQLDDLVIRIKFDFEGAVTSLNKEYLNVRKKDTEKVDAKVSSKFLTLSINSSRQTEFMRVDYKHDKKASLGASFHICVVPWREEYLESIQSKYEVDVPKESLRLKIDDAQFKIGLDQGILKAPEKVIVDQSVMNLSLDLQDNSYDIAFTAAAFPEGEAANLFIEHDGVTLPLIIPDDESKSVPLSGEQVQERIRENQEDIKWVDENLFVQGTYEFYGAESYRTFFEYEAQWVAQRIAFARLVSGGLEKEEIKLSPNLQKAYENFLSYFDAQSIPSLTYSSTEFREVALPYIRAYLTDIEELDANQPARQPGVDLSRLGIIETTNGFYFTAFHPLLVAYRLKRHNMLSDTSIERVITQRLGAESLIPFVSRERLYRPEIVREVPDWLHFRPIEELTVADSQKFVSNVIFDKMRQFKNHFGYLFLSDSKAPFLINVINLPDDREVLKGILEFLLEEIKKAGLEHLKDIEVTLYTDQRVASAFDEFSKLETVKDVERKYNVRLKVGTYEAEDVLRAIREHLFYFKKYDINRSWSIDYAHVTFYKMYAKERVVTQQMTDMPHDIALEGLYTSVPSTKDEDIYRMGFGLKGYDISDNLLLQTAAATNELMANTKNGGNDSYIKGNTTYLHIETVAEQMLNEIFDRSHWVTFIEPSVDLEFFQDFDELIIIHYSDQYTSSQKYDAITVTNKSMQYKDVIRNFLESKGVSKEEEQITQAIQAFNAYNGEWLLRIIGSRGHEDREKLSIISGVKYMVALLEHPQILWVPISLEEILRVAGVFGLGKREGVFSAKNLGLKGATSDDILLVGLEDKGEVVHLHIYPVEVKIGKITQSVVSKAKEQVMRTKEGIIRALTSEDQGAFVTQFYQTFILQLVVASAQKMVQGELWGHLDYGLSDELIEKLFKLQIHISTELDESIGKAGVLLFESGLLARSTTIEDGVQLYHFHEEDGYNGIVTAYEDVFDWLHNQDNDFIREKFLKYIYQPTNILLNNESLNTKKEDIDYVEDRRTQYQNSMMEENDVSSQEEYQKSVEEVNVQQPEESASVTEEDIQTEIKSEDSTETVESTSRLHPKPIEEVRLKIGTAEGTTKDIYWEYGHRELANRHMLIVGKSGQGKTYFMQALLMEQALQGIPSIIIDYTDGFLPNQLEETFNDALAGKVKHRVVIQQKLPINPFTQHEADYGGILMKEQSIDVATRMKSVFKSSYNLGAQQENAIYEATMEGLKKYGDQNFSIRHLGEQLREMDDNPAAGTTLSRIRPLVDRNPFIQGETIDWKEHLESDGEILILQLTGFDRQEQVLLTEFVLWDLWNYSLREGTKDIPLTVVMDEAQNLDHRENSPSAKILTEGRKFGWSGWYATQIVKSQFDKDEVARLQNTGQKVYFLPPDDEIPGIAKNLEDERYDRSYWEMKLRSLRKGQCIVHGPHLQSDGTLSRSEPVVVNVSSLEERLKE